MHRIHVSGHHLHENHGRSLSGDLNNPRIGWWRPAMWAVAVSLSCFGFQLTGALADSVGMESPLVLSLVLRFGTSLIFVISLLQSRLRIRKDTAGLAFAVAIMFLLLYGFNLIIKTQDPEYSLGRPQEEYVGYFLTFVLIPFLGAASALSQKRLIFARNALLLVTGASVFVYCLSYGPDSFTGSRFRPFESVNPIGVGYAGLVAATLAAWTLYRNHSRPAISVQLVMYLVMASGVALALLVGQRQVVLSGALTVFFFVFVSGGRFARWGVVRRVSLGCVFGGIVCAVIYAGLAEQTLIRVDNTTARIEHGEEARLMYWTEAIRLFEDNPVLGGPIELPVAQTYPHNLLIESFMVTGLPGGLLLTTFLLIVSLLALRLMRSPVLGWVGLVYYQLLVSAMLSGALYNNVWYWVFAGMTLSAYRVEKRLMFPPGRRVKPQQPPPRTPRGINYQRSSDIG